MIIFSFLPVCFIFIFFIHPQKNTRFRDTSLFDLVCFQWESEKCAELGHLISYIIIIAGCPLEVVAFKYSPHGHDSYQHRAPLSPYHTAN